MSYNLSPIGNAQFEDANGNPLVGGKIYTYQAGSSTPAATYTDNTGSTPQANPIILNSLGLPSSPVWMQGGVQLKFVIQDSTGVTLKTFDNISGINDVNSSGSEWSQYGSSPTYVNGTTFTVAGDQTLVFDQYRRVKATVTAGSVYGYISSSSYGSGITTVVLSMDSGSLDAGLSAIYYAVLDAANPSVPGNFIKGQDVPKQTWTGVTTAGVAPAFTISTSLGASVALAAGQRFRVSFNAAGTTGSNTLNRDGLGAKSLKQLDSSGGKVPASVASGQRSDVEYDGTDMVILDKAATSMMSTAAIAATTGSAIDFPGAPSWAKRITMSLNSVSTTGTAGLRFQIGPTTVPETSGYVGAQFESSGVSTNNFTAGFDTASVGASNAYSGTLVLTLVSGNTWVASSVTVSDTSTSVRTLAGRKTLAGTLGVIRLTTTNGTDTFDAGSVSVLYEG